MKRRPVLIRWEKGPGRLALSVGFVLAEDAERVILTGTIEGNQPNGMVSILTSQVRERVALEEAS